MPSPGRRVPPSRTGCICARRKQGSMTTQFAKGQRITGKVRTDLRQKLAARYQEGASIRALAESTGRSYGFIHRLLAESDVPLRRRGGGKLASKRRATTVTNQ